MVLDQRLFHIKCHSSHRIQGTFRYEDDIDLREAEFDEEYIEDRPQDTDAAEDDNISDDDDEEYVEPLKQEKH